MNPILRFVALLSAVLLVGLLTGCVAVRELSPAHQVREWT